MPDFTTSDGVRLHYRDEGSGLPLLCLSGLTRNGSDFDYLAPHLPPLRLIRLDYRGRGQSDWADHRSYTIPRESQDAIELLDHLALPKAAILGTSRGGLIAMVLAASAKDRLSGVALNDIGPELDTTGLEVIRGYIGRKPMVKTLEEVVDLRPALMSDFANVPQSRWREEAERLYRETPQGLELTYDPALREAVLEAGAQPAPDLWPLYDALAGLPLAILRGANSNILSAATAEEMCRRRPDAIFAEIPDRGHIPFLDEPQSLAALHRFIGELA